MVCSCWTQQSCPCCSNRRRLTDVNCPGCSKCKQRKVRCGEQKPVCKACARLCLDCEYLDGKRELLQQLASLNGQHDGSRSRRSRYLIRFVDCNRSTKNRVHVPDNSPGDISRGENEARTPTIVGVSSPDEDNITARLSTMGARASGACQTWQSQNPRFESGSSSTRPPGIQPYGEGDAQRQTMAHCIEPNQQSFSSDLDSTLASDVPLQFLDAFDPSLWFNPLVDAVRGWDHVGPGGFPGINSTESYGNSPLLPTQQDTSPGACASPSESMRGMGVQISNGEHSLIQHFLTSMKQYSTKLLESAEEDINYSMFSNLGLFNAQLFHAMMAFAALHRAQTQDSFFSQAEQRYQRATALLFEDENPHNHLDVTISTVWFLLQYELLRACGVVRFCDLLAHLAHALDTYPTHHASSSSGLSKVGTRTLVSISTYDVRALASGGRGGHFLRSLEKFLPARVLLGEPASSLSGGPLAPLSLSISASSALDHAALLRLRLRCNLLHGRILMLSSPGGGSRDEVTLTEDDPECIALRRLMIEQHEIFERRGNAVTDFSMQVATGKMPQTDGELPLQHYIYLLALSSVYAVFLDYHQAIPIVDGSSCAAEALSSSKSSGSTNNHAVFLSAEECSARMVHTAWFIRENRNLSPQSVWPSLLLAAGVASTDGVHRAWVLSSLKEIDHWATHFLQTRVLFEAVYKTQLRLQPGQVVDVLKIQSQTTGPFII